MDGLFKDRVDWVNKDPAKAARVVWHVLSRASGNSTFFEHLAHLGDGRLSSATLQALAAETAPGQTAVSVDRRPAAPAVASHTAYIGQPEQRRALQPEAPKVSRPSRPRSPSPGFEERPSTSCAMAPVRKEAPASSASREAAVPFSQANFLDDEVSAFARRCALNPAEVVSMDDQLSDGVSCSLPALLQNIQKFQRHVKLDRIRLRLHRYVLHVLYSHIKSALESHYAVKQYLAEVAPQPFFPGKNDKASASKYAQWVRDFGGPGVLFCDIKIDDRDTSQQGSRREQFIDEHVAAGILPIVQGLNPVAIKVCEDLWTKAVSWLNEHGDIQWRLVFPESDSYNVSPTAGLYSSPFFTQTSVPTSCEKTSLRRRRRSSAEVSSYKIPRRTGRDVFMSPGAESSRSADCRSDISRVGSNNDMSGGLASYSTVSTPSCFGSVDEYVSAEFDGEHSSIPLMDLDLPLIQNAEYPMNAWFPDPIVPDENYLMSYMPDSGFAVDMPLQTTCTPVPPRNAPYAL